MSIQSYNKTNQILICFKVIILGSIGNTIVGALTGLIGSLCLQHHPLITISIIWIGALAGLIGGLLHAFIVFLTSYLFTSYNSFKSNQIKSLSKEILLIFTHAPLWSMIGATISYTILVKNPLITHHPSNLSNRLSFFLVLLSALIGTFLIGLYSILMFYFTKSESHLLILQNGLILLFNNQSFKNQNRFINLDLSVNDLSSLDLKIQLVS